MGGFTGSFYDGSSGSGPSPGSGGSILWAPGTAGAFQSGPAVVAFLAANAAAGGGPVLVWLDFAGVGGTDSIGPGPGTVDLFHATFAVITPGGPGVCVIDVPDGVVIHDPGMCVNGVVIVTHGTAAPSITFTPGNPAIFQSRLNGGLENAGTYPAIDLVPGAFLVLVSELSGVYLTGTAPLVRMAAGAFLIIASTQGGTIQADLVSSLAPGDGTIVYRGDGTGPSPLPNNAGFSGAIYLANVGPTPTAVPTALRPVPVIGDIPTALEVYDTDINNVVSYAGSPGDWYNLAGAQSIVVGTGDADSLDLVAAGQRVRRVLIRILTAYSPGATIEVGPVGGPTNRIAQVADSVPQAPGLYIVDQLTSWVTQARIRVTIGGAPVAGAAVVDVEYN